MLNNKINTSSDNRDTFRWFLSQDNERVLIEAKCGSVWFPAAEVSVPEARLTMKMCSWRDSPLLFGIVEEICAECAAERAAA